MNETEENSNESYHVHTGTDNDSWRDSDIPSKVLMNTAETSIEVSAFLFSAADKL
jgi:hypothetical protein